MRKIFFAGAIVFVVIVAIFVSNQSEQAVNTVTTVKESKDKINPYSIASLKARSYDSDIKIENEIRKTDIFESFKVSYLSDGLKLFALMNKPLNMANGNGLPVVIVNHGHIDPDVFSTERSYINTSAFFANNGYLVLKPDYRGHDNSQGEAEGLVSRIDYTIDVLNLVAAARKMPEVNKDKIYMYGHSMGGDVTLRVLEVSEWIKAATLWAPAVTDFPESVLYFARKNNRDRRLQKYQQELASLFSPQDYDKVSTFANISLVNEPVIIHHSMTDESVPYSWGVNLADKMKNEGKNVELFTYPKDNHDIAKNWSTALNRDLEFFAKY